MTRGWEGARDSLRLLWVLALRAEGAFLEAFVATVTASLKAGKEVRLVGFGSFVPVRRAAGVSRNPKTGAKVDRAASTTARFRIGETLKNALN